MSMKINHQLCSPETLKKEYPMADSLKALKEKRDEEIKAIFAGESDKILCKEYVKLMERKEIH